MVDRYEGEFSATSTAYFTKSWNYISNFRQRKLCGWRNVCLRALMQYVEYVHAYLLKEIVILTDTFSKLYNAKYITFAFLWDYWVASQIDQEIIWDWAKHFIDAIYYFFFSGYKYRSLILSLISYCNYVNIIHIEVFDCNVRSIKITWQRLR